MKYDTFQMNVLYCVYKMHYFPKISSILRLLFDENNQCN